jgi:hypothetical protein
MALLMIAQVKVATDDHDSNGLTGRQDEIVFPPNKDRTRIYALSMTEKRSALTPEILSQRWGIGLDTAKKTLQATTQASVRNVLAPGKRKVRQCLDHLKFPNLRGQYYTDTMFFKTNQREDTSLRKFLPMVTDKIDSIHSPANVLQAKH